jgi:hypothetical protein
MCSLRLERLKQHYHTYIMTENNTTRLDSNANTSNCPNRTERGKEGKKRRNRLTVGGHTADIS